MSRDTKYIIYRSRFQPSYEPHHKEALAQMKVSKFHEGKTILLGFVDDDGFLSGYNPRTTKVIEALYKQLGGDAKTYKSRFVIDEFNPSSPGAVLSSIYDSQDINYDGIYYLPNVAIASSLIYDHGPKKDFKFIYRWFIHEDPRQLYWYFPIYDLDDINDIGFISVKMYERFSQSADDYPDLEHISFNRYNYGKGRDNIFQLHGTQFGAYAFGISKVDKSKEHITSMQKTVLNGLTIPTVESIPFIYLWGDANKIVDGFIRILDFYKTISVTLNSGQQNLLGAESRSFQNIKKSLLDNKTEYSKDLENLFRTTDNLLRRTHSVFPKPILMNYELQGFSKFLEALGLVSKSFNEKCNQTCIDSPNENCPTCKDWLECSRESSARGKAILDLLKSIKS